MPQRNEVTVVGELDGKTALVTGTTGIGRAVAVRFAEAGARVVAGGIDEQANQELSSIRAQKQIPLFVERCDVADPASVRALVDAAVGRLGGIDILVNAAAIHPFGNVLDTEVETWNRCIAVNVSSVFLLARAVIPEMKKRGGGCIINLASVQGYACQPGVVAYAASKGAIHSLTRALALVNSISPGSVATPMLAKSARHFSPDIPVEEVFARFGAAHPLGRIGTPEEVAELAAFVASDKAGFCTGTDFVVDGGLLAGIAVR
jgi:meso-butanediol dehydrogenase / (S,S)-butanediol dehydrogenase / diacetyl reductase